MADGAQKKQKIAILGGGMAAMAAAFELTSRPGWKDRFEITVYQQGFRLGGKGASGRNRAASDRIEEHGLHIWMGFYENAFRLMRDCYRELGRGPGVPLSSFHDAFHPHDLIVLQEQVHGRWRSWPLQFERNGATPGDGGPLPTGVDYLVELLRWVAGVIAESPLAQKAEPFLQKIRRVLDLDGDDRPGVLGAIGETALDSLLTAAAFLRAGAEPDLEDASLRSDEGLLALGLLLEGVLRWARDEIGERVQHDDVLRRLWISVELAVVTIRGILRDGLAAPPFDFTKVDDWDLKDWLRKHGASEVTAESAPVNALYDLIFSRDHGFAAGTAIYGALRMLFTYKGAIFWKMQGGMGDVVFAPLYTVLRRRGVRFAFFHRVDALRVSPDGRRVAAIEMGRQATPRSGEYHPLVDVKGLPCWPSEPLWDQLVEGEGLRERGVDLESFWTDHDADAGKVRLEADTDFDRVIFGISIAAVKPLCAELLPHSRRLRECAEKVATAPTQAFQIWLTPTLDQMGWAGPSPVLGTYEKPFDTWADMSYLIARERWSGAHTPGTLAYFCGALPERAGDAAAYDAPRLAPGAPHPVRVACDRAREGSVAWLRRSAGALWPHAATTHDPAELNWYLLSDPSDRDGEARFDAQYWRGNVNPSDRYVLSVPGTTRYRLRAHESGFDNLVLAGDWLLTGLSAGCIEAATMGGMQASRAISGFPRTIHGDVTNEPPALPSPPEPPVIPSRQPLYVDRGGEIVFRHPFEQQATRLFAFPLQADAAALVDLCDRLLNHPLRGATVYRPIGPFVVLTFADIGAIRSLDERDAAKGWMPERDVAFWVPVAAGSRHGQRFVPERFGGFIPYMFVDSPLAVATGREIFGFPKVQAALVMPERESDPAAFSVDTLVLPRFGRDARVEMRRVLEVERTDRTPIGPRSSVWDALSAVRSELTSSVKEALFGPGSEPGSPVTFLLDLFQMFGHPPGSTFGAPGRLTAPSAPNPEGAPSVPPVRMIFLKQFRDAVDCRRACYQAVVEVPAVVRTFRAGGYLPGAFRVDVPHFDSLPIARDLGLAEGPLSPLLAVWLDLDFDVGCAEIVGGSP